MSKLDVAEEGIEVVVIFTVVLHRLGTSSPNTREIRCKCPHLIAVIVAKSAQGKPPTDLTKLFDATFLILHRGAVVYESARSRHLLLAHLERLGDAYSRTRPSRQW